MSPSTYTRTNKFFIGSIKPIRAATIFTPPSVITMPSFENVLAAIDKITRLIGYEITKNPKKRPHLLRVFVWCSNINLTVAITELVGFLYYVRNDLMKFLIQTQLIMIDFTVVGVAISLVTYHDDVIGLLEWCAGRHQLHNPTQRKYSWTFFDDAYRHSFLIIKLGALLVFFALTTIIVLNTATGFFVEQFPLPLPFFMPYLPPTNVWTYIINWLHQGWAGITVFSLYTAIICIVIIPMRYIIANMDATLNVIADMKELSGELGFIEWLRLSHLMYMDCKM